MILFKFHQDVYVTVGLQFTLQREPVNRQLYDVVLAAEILNPGGGNMIFQFKHIPICGCRLGMDENELPIINNAPIFFFNVSSEKLSTS